MKSFILILSVLSVTPSFARSLAPLTCSAGELGEDNRIEIVLSPRKSVSINLHETGITAESEQTVRNGNSVAILNQNLSGSSEGEETNSITNALMVFDPKTMTLNLTLILNDAVIASAQTLNCK